MNGNSVFEIANLVKNSRSFVVFTGAGISTESGIPDFRSPGGVWTKYKTVFFDEFMTSESARFEYWRQKCEADEGIRAAKPNVAHRTLAAWEASGRLRGVITQNIDELHQIAGHRRVLELHGTARKVACMDCGDRNDARPFVQQFMERKALPICQECGSDRLKHATVSFGQSLPANVLSEAETWCREADLMFAVGSSLVVTPAADLPRIAKRQGAHLVIINRDPTPLDDIADIVVNQSIGATFEEIAKQLADGMSNF